jgi:hypothetical protein
MEPPGWRTCQKVLLMGCLRFGAYEAEGKASAGNGSEGMMNYLPPSTLLI